MTNKTNLTELYRTAAKLRDDGFGDIITYSPKVFIPLTKLCRDVCHYCTFSRPPIKGKKAYLSLEEVLKIARAGASAGCTEALFTLGDKPELRYRVAREELASLGHDTTISYLAEVAQSVLEETGLLPHLNPGILTTQDFNKLRPVSASMGLMLEGVSLKLALRGGPHFGSPDKEPEARLKTIRLAGEAGVPFTTGILIGIGENRKERISALNKIFDLHREYGHIQEIIIQNFKAKPDTKMANWPEPDTQELCWTIATARKIFGSTMSIQAPPNLSGSEFPSLINAGINDYGGVSPITPDHVNPEAAWPEIGRLREATLRQGKILVPRLPIYPQYIFEGDWVSKEVRPTVIAAMDSDGLARNDNWSPGLAAPFPAAPSVLDGTLWSISKELSRAANGQRMEERVVSELFEARGSVFREVVGLADSLRRTSVGDTVTYAVNRNINYTNVCGYRCGFCAFSKGKLSANLRGAPYDLALNEVARRAKEAWDRGATEVCLQGGIHPDYTGDTYLSIVKSVKEAAPDIHIHAFSPLEIKQGAATLGLPVNEYLSRLRDVGLGSLPGTAAEILDEEVRAVLCPDKLSTGEWLTIMETAHDLGIKTTSTIMYGHLERPIHQARHLLRLRDLQERTGGFTEFVPLPFVHMEAPIYHKGLARKGPTSREAVLMHAVARLALHPLIFNIQTSWVKLGMDGATACLSAGANDLGGSLMNESISRAAGAAHGQEFAPAEMKAFILGLGRKPRQRTTLYEDVDGERIIASDSAIELAPIIQTPASKFAHGEVSG